MGLFNKQGQGKHARPAKGASAGDAARVQEGFAGKAGQGQQEVGTTAAGKLSNGSDETVALERPDAPGGGAEAGSPSNGGASAPTASVGGATSGIGPDGLPDAAFEPREYVEEELEDEVESGKGEPADAKADAGGFVSATFGEIPSKKKHRGLKAFGIAAGVLVIVACGLYVAGAVVFMGRFLPNTTIGDHDLSLMTDGEVVELLDGIASDYRIDVVGNGFSYRADGSAFGLAVDSAGIVAAMHADMSPWEWPLLIAQRSHDQSDLMMVTFTKSASQPDVKAAIERHNEMSTPPTNATIVFDEKHAQFVIKPEEQGTQLDAAAVYVALDGAISALQPKLVLSDEQLLKPSVYATDEKLIESAELATGMVSAKLSLVMGGQPVGSVDGSMLSEFVTIDDNLDVTFREEELAAWVDETARGFNTVDTARTYTREDGKVITVSGGVYGWAVDAEGLKNAIIDGIKAGKVSEIEVPCIDTADVYNGPGERDWGNRYIDVDISEQHVRFYDGEGKLFWETDCISGSPDGTHDTVAGVWCVNAKESPSKLIGYENGKKIYETTVTFWMPFEGNSIGFHDATWQPSFGGSMYANGYGSHGCVNLSYAAAQELYGIIQEGDVVVVHA